MHSIGVARRAVASVRSWQSLVPTITLSLSKMPDRAVAHAPTMAMASDNGSVDAPEATHVIFDMDGLLLDSEELYSQAYQNVIDQLRPGKRYTFDFKAGLMGMAPVAMAERIIAHFDLPVTVDEWLQRLAEQQENLFPRAEPLPGISKLVHHFYKHGVPMAVATSSRERQFELKTARHSKLFSMFHHVVLGSDADVVRCKPAPDIFLVCAKRFGADQLSPERCLVFEDSPNGIRAAKTAGMQTVMVPDPRLPEAMRAEADVVVADAHTFRPELFGLPAYPYAPVKFVIFDMDGLLINTSAMADRASTKVVEKCGKQPRHDVFLRFKGRKAKDFASSLIREYDLPLTVEEFIKEYYKNFDLTLDKIRPLAGVERLINHLHSCGVPLAVATSSKAEAFVRKTAKLGHLFCKFQHVITSSHPSVKQGKPGPDIFRVAAAAFLSGAPPDDEAALEAVMAKPSFDAHCRKCLVFEDSPSGIEAAHTAGMQSVMIPDFPQNFEPDATLKATQLLMSMSNFRPEDFGLPAMSHGRKDSDLRVASDCDSLSNVPSTRAS